MITSINAHVRNTIMPEIDYKKQKIDNIQNQSVLDKSHKDYSYAATSLGRASISFQGVVKISPQMVKRLASEYASGKSLSQCVSVLSGLGVVLSVGHASKLLNSQSDWDEIKKLHVENNQTEKTILTEDIKQGVINDYCCGEIPAHISKKYGISRITVMRIVERNTDSDTLKKIHSQNNKATFPPISEETCARMIELYKNGMSAAAIGKELGCSASSVLYYISECNDYEKIKKIHIQNNQTKRFIPTPEFIEKAISEYRSGKQIYVIAKELECSATALNRYLKQQANYDEIEQEHIQNNQGVAIVTEDKVKQIVQLYREGMLCKDIAKKVGCADSTVSRYLKEQEDYDSLAVEHYSKSTRSRKGMRKSVITAEMIDKMIKLYREGYPYDYIAKMLKISGTTVSKYIQGNERFEEIEQMHIKNNKSSLAILTDDKIMLITLLYKQGKTTKQIASIVGCSNVTVGKILRDSDYWNEIQEEHIKNYNGPLAILTKEKIEQMEKLYREGKTSEQIAELLNCSFSAVMQHLKRHTEWKDIRNDFVENYSGKKIKLSEGKRAKIKELSKQGKTADEIAEIIGISNSTVRKYLKMNDN